MNYFKNNKTYQNLKHIKSVLPENIKKILSKSKQKFNNLDDIKNNWVKIAFDFSKHCKPIRISNNIEGMCLHLEVEKKFILEVDYERDNLIKKINSFYGFNLIKKIMINTYKISDKKNNQTKKKLINDKNQKKINNIKNIKLRKIFEDFDKN